MRAPAITMQSKRCARQNGNILIMAAITLSTAVILLASIDIGFLFYQKRELQKVADMAALAGTQQLVKDIAEEGPGGTCGDAFTNAIANAKANGFDGQITTTCGLWDPQTTEDAPHYAMISNNSLSPITPNAISVTLNRSFGSFFSAWTEQSVHTSAIAMGTPSEPTAVFSVGSRLLRLEGGVVPNLLSAIGLNISGTDLASYNGIANAKVHTSGLLQALGFNVPLNANVGTLASLLETNATGCAQNSCSLRAILDALSGVVGDQSDFIDLLGIEAEKLDLQVKLLSDENGRGLLAFLETANTQSALKADITVGELINTALQIANNEHAIDLPGLNVNLQPLANVTTRLGIVEPPSIGIGGVGATAYTSQLRLYTKIDANAVLLNASIPAIIDLVNGEGTVVALCEEKNEAGKDTATIHVSSPVLGACVGKIESASIFSRTTSCETGLEDHRLLSVLGNTLRVDSSFKLDALPNESTVTLIKGETKATGRNDLELGTTLSNLYKAVLAEVLGKLLTESDGNVTRQNLVANLISSTGNTVGSATNVVNHALTDLSSFITSLSNANASLGSVVMGLLTGITNLVGNLLTGVLTLVSNLLGDLGCGLAILIGQAAYDACKLSQEKTALENQLNGNQTGNGQSVSKVLLALLGLVVDLLEPILNQVGNSLASLLETLLGIQLGQVDVTLIDLKCGVESNVRLVH